MTRGTGKRAALAVLLLGTVLAAGGCGGKKPSTTTSTGACTAVSPPAAAARSRTKPSAALAPGMQYDVTMQTNCGAFTIRLDQAQSPHAAASFVALVKSGFFDRTTFHRIVRGFVIQGGDPTATGAGGPGYTTVDRPPADAAYTRGVVAMAKTNTQAAGTAGSQFFVVTEANAGLPPDYAIIGKVVAGLDVVERIGTHGDANEQPTMAIEIEHATVKVS